MSSRPIPALSRLRGRPWRLAVLLLWVAAFAFNLAAAFDKPAQAGTLAGDLQFLCHSGGDGSAPADPVDDADDQAGGTHCGLCYVFAAGILATPGQEQVAVLTPSAEGGLPLAARTAPPGTAPPATQAHPRAPPASV